MALWPDGTSVARLDRRPCPPGACQARRTDGAGGRRAGADREARKLTADLVEVPVQLFPEDGRHAFVGLADGEVWRLRMEDGRWTNLTADGQPRIASLVWPSPTVSDAQSFPQLVLAVEEEEATVWYSLDLPSGALRRLARPSTSSELLDFVPEPDTAVLAAVDRTGARLWTSKPAFEEHMSVLETNTWLSEIAEGEVRRIDYRGLDGNDLKGRTRCGTCATAGSGSPWREATRRPAGQTRRPPARPPARLRSRTVDPAEAPRRRPRRRSRP